MEAQLHRSRPMALDALIVTAAVVVSAILAAALISVPIRVGPVTMRAKMGFGLSGQTTVRVPPFGLAHAHTHVGPARLVVAVEDVDIAAVERLLAQRTEDPSPDLPSFAPAGESTLTVTDLLEIETRAAGTRLVGLVLAVAALSAPIASFSVLALRRRPSVVAAAAAAAFVAVLTSGVLGASTFDSGALAEPHLEGALTFVPRLEAVFTTRLSVIERLRDQVSEVADQIAAYYADPRSIASGGGLPGTFRVLHISDAHLDPVGAQLARSLARSYEASLVIDTGDLVITGVSEEVRLLPSLVITSAPVLYVAGNHDTQAVVDELTRLGNVTVLTSETVVVDGLRVFPIADPESLSPRIEPDRAAVRAATLAAAQRLRALEGAGMPRPDIVAMHNPLAERALVGLAPLVLTGHTHSERLYVSDGTVRLNSGTLGGMPYDPSLTDRARLPHSASILYYTATLPRRLIAIDRISVSPDRTTSLTRQVIDESLLP